MKFSAFKTNIFIFTAVIFCISAISTSSHAQVGANNKVVNNVFSLDSLKSFFWPSLGSSNSFQKQDAPLSTSSSSEKSGQKRVCENDDCSPPPPRRRFCEPDDPCSCGKRCGNGEGNA
jgi:hypothetical protein